MNESRNNDIELRQHCAAFLHDLDHQRRVEDAVRFVRGGTGEVQLAGHDLPARRLDLEVDVLGTPGR